jgi:hypothetical protein
MGAPAGAPARTARPERRGGSAQIAVLGVCGACVLTALLVFGVRLDEAIRYICFELGFALAPGLALLTVLARRPRPLADTIAIAWPLGLAAEIGCFLLAAALGERWLLALYPAILLAACAPVLWSARAELRLPSPRWGRPVAAETAPAVLLLVAASAWVVSLVLFAPSPLPREAGSVSYYPDLMFHLSLAAEMLHHWPFLDPSVSGQSLHYHIFANVDMAAAAQVTRVDLATILMRLQPAALISLIGVQLFALGRKVGGNATMGLVAATLGLLAGELSFSGTAVFGGGASVLGFLYSPSYELGAVFFLAILMLLVEALAQQARPRGWWPALGLLALAAAGAKSSVVPVVAGGLCLFMLGAAGTRGGRLAEDARKLAVVLVAGAVLYVLLYRGGGQGVVLKPLDFLSYTDLASLYRQAGRSPAHVLASAVAVLVVLCGSLMALAGIALERSRWCSRAAASSPERLLMCMLAASLPPFLLLGVPGDSELYFLVYGYLAAVIVSAAGVVKAAAGMRSWPAARAGRPHVPVRAAVLAAVALTVPAGAYQLTAPTLERWLHGLPAAKASGESFDRGMTAGLWRGLLWVRTHTQPSTVIAVNNHYLEDDRDSRYFYYSAIAERRVFLQSWEYTPKGYEYLSRGLTSTPFPTLLRLNEAAVADASPAAIATLRSRYGVGYILIDRRHGPVAAGLSRVARVVYANPDVTVYRIT